MQLIDVYYHGDRCQLLYWLLAERNGETNISHRVMPSWDEHIRFVAGHPYEAWYLIVDRNLIVGACYLTKQSEIGVQIFKANQGKGHGKAAVNALMSLFGPRRYLANINPANERSAKMFQGLGFKLIQHTYANA